MLQITKKFVKKEIWNRLNSIISENFMWGLTSSIKLSKCYKDKDCPYSTYRVIFNVQCSVVDYLSVDIFIDIIVSEDEIEIQFLNCEGEEVLETVPLGDCSFEDIYEYLFTVFPLNSHGI